MLYIYSTDRHFESTRDAGLDLRSGAMVEAQHSAGALGASDGARCRFGMGIRLDEAIFDPLMIPHPVIVSGGSNDANASLTNHVESVFLLLLRPGPLSFFELNP